MSDVITAQKSKGEVLVYQRGQIPEKIKGLENDIESGPADQKSGNGSRNGKEKINIRRQTSIVSWKDVVYDIKIKGEERRILDRVDGWVKPGTLTALMVILFHPGNMLTYRVYLEQERPLY
jgi:ATP-binding cassette subfamily G (WHITE) protein 2 (PDR)